MRIAVFIHGGIGGGKHQQGVPALHYLLQDLAKTHEVAVYNHINTAPLEHDYALYSAPSWLKQPSLRWLWIAMVFLAHHLKHRHQLLHGFWAIPGGRFAHLMSKIVRRPLVITFMGGESANLPDIPYGFLSSPKTKDTLKKLSLAADAVVLLSEHAKTNLLAAGIQFRTQQIIQFGIPTELFSYEPNTIRPPYKFVNVGNIHPTKDPMTLIEGFALFLEENEAHLTIIGGDWWEGKVQERAQTLGISSHVSFLGEIPYPEVAKNIRDSDAMLHSSRHEGQGMIFLEAMASGTLIISTPVGIAAELGGTVVANFPPQEPIALARVVKEVMEDAERRTRMLKSGKEWADKHTIPAATSSYVELYQTILER